VSSAASDPYLDPASGVLRNLLGITDAAELARAEAALSASRLIDLERRRLPGRYDLAHLQAFHRYILGDVYAWADQLRTVSIAKGSMFCLPQHLESYAADVFGPLAAADRLPILFAFWCECLRADRDVSPAFVLSGQVGDLEAELFVDGCLH
jgi:fido (protein-threonine AMPylation protein)